MRSDAQHNLPELNTELPFQALIKKPAALIALATSVVLTVIVWITTFLFTVSSVAAYLTQTVAAGPSGDLLPTGMLRLSSSRIAAGATQRVQTDALVLEAKRTLTQLGDVPPTNILLNLPSIAPPVVEQPVSSKPAPAAEPLIETAGIQPLRAIQEQPASNEHAKSTENIVAQPQRSQTSCGDGLWGEICRERMRWNYCHPDKWDLVAECVVQKFEVSYSLY
jgi:hypothetical protein